MSISGYPSSTSVTAGDPIDFHLSTDAPGDYTLYVRRVGKDPDPGRAITVRGLVERTIPDGGYRDGFDWPSSCTYTVPADLPTGLYRLSVSPDPAAEPGHTILPFVVRPRRPGAASKVLLSVCFVTPQAYNNMGGKSLYDHNSPGGRASVVSFDRPFASGGILDESYEAKLLKWLEREELAVEYCSNVDLHTAPALLAAYDCLVVAGHDEYWSKEMRDQVDAFVSSGGNLVVLSGNSCYRQVRLEKGARSLVFHKYSGADPEPDRTRATVSFAQPPLSRPANATLGAGFTAGAEFSPEGTADAFTLQFRDHWALRGVTAAPGAFMTYETDAAEFVLEQAFGMEYARATGADGTPPTCTILGYADLRHWRGKPGMATMTLLQRGGTVFHGGAIDWTVALPGDAALQQITRNVLARLRERRAPAWEELGHANDVKAMTAHGGMLYAATGDGQLWRRHPVGANANWTRFGTAPGVRALASASGKLFALLASGELQAGTVGAGSVAWAKYGVAPAGAATLAAVGEMLYAVDGDGWLNTLSLRAPAEWRRVNEKPWKTPLKGLTCLAACDDVLYARTGDGRLVRTNQDIVWESTGWTAVSTADDLRGMAVADRLLFAATAANRLVRLDLNNLPVPAPAMAQEAPARIQVAGLEIAGAALVA